MGLHPLEFSECYLDSPTFRDKVKSHEAELDKTNRFIKELYKDGKNLMNATKRKFYQLELQMLHDQETVMRHFPLPYSFTHIGHSQIDMLFVW